MDAKVRRLITCHIIPKSRYRTSLRQGRKWSKKIHPTRIDLKKTTRICLKKYIDTTDWIPQLVNTDENRI